MSGLERDELGDCCVDACGIDLREDGGELRGGLSR